jgi:hypothetical protein
VLSACVDADNVLKWQTTNATDSHMTRIASSDYPRLSRDDFITNIQHSSQPFVNCIAHNIVLVGHRSNDPDYRNSTGLVVVILMNKSSSLPFSVLTRTRIASGALY